METKSDFFEEKMKRKTTYQGSGSGKKLFVYEGKNHPHAAQKPVQMEIK